MGLSRRLSQDELHNAITELDQAIHAHEQWIDEIIAALVCHLPPDARDLEEDCWRHCRFGQWYYSSGISKLADQPGFAEVESEHKRMHQYAGSLLNASVRGIPISLADYDRFTSALKRMRLEIMSLKRELEVALYNIDPLTGVPGRLQMLKKLRDDREFVTRDVHRCAVAMFDLDKFKSVNDTHGHIAGDHVLQAIAGYVQAHLRRYDAFFRYGGEEFLLCMPDTDAQTARDICDRLRSELGGLLHDPEGNGGFRVTVSIGIAELSKDCSVEESIHRADVALFAAKEAGRDRVVLWDPALEAGRCAA